MKFVIKILLLLFLLFLLMLNQCGDVLLKRSDPDPNVLLAELFPDGKHAEIEIAYYYSHILVSGGYVFYYIHFNDETLLSNNGFIREFPEADQAFVSEYYLLRINNLTSLPSEFDFNEFVPHQCLSKQLVARQAQAFLGNSKKNTDSYSAVIIVFIP